MNRPNVVIAECLKASKKSCVGIGMKSPSQIICNLIIQNMQLPTLQIIVFIVRVLQT